MANFTLQLGDCLETLKTLPDGSVDSVITDPPYGLSQHTPQQVADCLGAWLRGEEYKPKGKGFMGKSWDAWVPSPAVWRECLRVLKPGGHLLAFAGTRSMDLMSMAVRLAGFELRDSVGYAHDGGGAPLLAWAYGSGFPKSHNLQGDWQGWGTALKPAWEPIILARKPLEGTVAENVLKHGTGALNIDGCRVVQDKDDESGWSKTGSKASSNRAMSGANYERNPKPDNHEGRFPANIIHDGSDAVTVGFPNTKSPSGMSYRKAGENRAMSGGNTERGMSKNGHGDEGSAARFFFRAGHEKEDLLFCRAKAILSAWKLTKGVQPCSQENASVAESSLCLSRQAVVSVLSDAVIAASRGGRLLSDARGLSTTATESECERLCETLITAMLISESVALPAPSQDVLIQNGCHVNVAAIQKPTDTMTITISLPKSGGYAEHVTFSIMPSSMAHGARGLNDRFRYCAKASKKDRDDGNIHPTVKPTALMRYLCRLVTPPNGTVLDPFTGSGSTGKAAILEGFNFIGCEMQPDYHAIAKARIEAACTT